ncbi:MAG: hypothetical protein RI549_08320 [Wenzhouxiangella sp.]|nr:hypothetical protein [Wenzhouxiangella sp.]
MPSGDLDLPKHAVCKCYAIANQANQAAQSELAGAVARVEAISITDPLHLATKRFDVGLLMSVGADL